MLDKRNVFMAGTEYFSETAQPRYHIPLNIMREITITHSEFAALIRLSTITHNPLTFNTSQRSSINLEKLRPLADTHLWTFLLHSSYSSSQIYSHMVGRPAEILTSHQKKKKKTKSWSGSKFIDNFALA